MTQPQAANAITTPAEREEMLAVMRRAKDSFYFMAVQVGDHRFVEFAGMIGEYIKLCEAAHEKGYDLTELHHVMRPYHAHYVGEKIGCIYGTTFYREAKTLSGFLAAVVGLEAHELEGSTLTIAAVPPPKKEPG